MTAIAANLSEPRLRWAAEGLEAILTLRGRACTVAWARAAAEDETRIAALAVLEQVPLSLNLLADLERARQSGNPRKIAKVNRRLDSLLGRLGRDEQDAEGPPGATGAHRFAK